MKKLSLIFHFFCFVPLAALFISFILFQLSSRGLAEGLIIIAISWSGYVLTIPAAHGRIVLGVINKLLGRRPIFPEHYVWLCAAALQVWMFVMYPYIYQKTVITYLFYRIFTVPQFLILVLLGALGAWFRVLTWRFVSPDYRLSLAFIRYAIVVTGVLAFFFLMRCDLIIILNSLANG